MTLSGKGHTFAGCIPFPCSSPPGCSGGLLQTEELVLIEAVMFYAGMSACGELIVALVSSHVTILFTSDAAFLRCNKGTEAANRKAKLVANLDTACSVFLYLILHVICKSWL